MSDSDITVTVEPAPDPAATASAKRSPRWWYSRDMKRGFAWAEVKGFHFHPSNTPGFDMQCLYIYLSAGILRLTGVETEEVHKELIK